MKTNTPLQAHKVFLTLAALFAIIGFGPFGGSMTDGFFKALFGVFFILFFIFNLLKDERIDEPECKEGAGDPRENLDVQAFGRKEEAA